MKSQLITNNHEKLINWQKAQLFKKVSNKGTFIILSSGREYDTMTFEGIVIYSENKDYKIGHYCKYWLKADAILCNTDTQITLSN